MTFQQHWPRGGNVYWQGVQRTGLLGEAYIDGILYIAHRGNPNQYPENTMEAYAACVADGVKAIEQDCWLLSDGALGVMYDSTVNRTTTSTGSTASYDATTWATLEVDIGDTLGGAWQGTRQTPPLFSQVVTEFGGEVLLVVEAKNTGAGAAIVTELLAQGVPRDGAIVQAFERAELDAALAAGYKTMWLGNTINPVTAADDGIDYIGASSTVGQAYIESHRLTGREVVIYTIDRHYQRDSFITLGANGFFSDDSYYLSGQHVATEDPFDSQNWGPGHLSMIGGRGAFVSPNEWGLDPTTDVRRQVLQGWGSPIGGANTPDSYTIDFTVRFQNLGGQWASIFVCMPDDKPYLSSDADGVGFNLLFRVNGTLEIFILNGGTGASIATQTGTNLANNTPYDMRATVTPTTIRLDNLTRSQFVQVANATYRGGYFNFGCRGPSRPYFSNVVVS